MLYYSNVVLQGIHIFINYVYFILSDVNECGNEIACGENQVCFNTYGSYMCECGIGYEDDGGSNCKGINFIANHECL